VQVRSEDLERLRERSHRSIDTLVRRGRDAVAHLRAQVRALSPQQTLDRGYAVVQTAHGAVVRSPADAPPDTELAIRLARGKLTAVVLSGQDDDQDTMHDRKAPQ
ncbi:MAG: exodeoxyribonuclease VII large subunit, partial [Micrococcaceae bacterium]|nr:exodeoxyribonuclease VII large subunit [Micrococcaceae bacterium]